MRAALVAACLVVLTGCGSTPAERGPGGVNVAGLQLPEALAELIPAGADPSLGPDDRVVRECGITPTFSCVHTSFSIPGHDGISEQIRLLRATVTRRGWRVEGVRRYGAGAVVDVARAAYHARYTVSAELTRGGPAFVQLVVYGSEVELPAPSAAARAHWSEEKRRFVEAAEAVCMEAFARAKGHDDLAPSLARALERLRAIEPPRGDEDRVAAIVRLLSRLTAATRVLTDENGENALPAAVAAGKLAKRFNRAASRYGLQHCRVG
jgi:hypothetical protein